VFYISTSTALALFELYDLFFNYVSTQMAEGRDEDNNYPVSSSVDALSSHFTDLTMFPHYQPNHTTDGNKSSLHGTDLPAMLQ